MENINIILDEDNYNNDININDLEMIKDFENLDFENSEFENFNEINNDFIFSEIKNYDINYTTKELYLICDYYEITNKRLKKMDLINLILFFENNPDNYEIVEKRQQFWFYMKELKEDKFMKKFIIWK